jgi:hypothetical protein
MNQTKNKGQNMATPSHAVRSRAATKKRAKSAEEKLSAKMGDFVEKAALHMHDEEFEQAHKKSLEIISRVRASRRETK